MKRNASIALVALIIFTMVNLIGGIANNDKGYEWNTNDVIEVIPLHMFFCFLFWLTCIPNIQIRKTLRLPFLGMLFWTLISFIYWTNESGISQMATGDFIYDTVPAFCFFVNSIGLSFISDSDLYLIGVLIIGVTFYQILVFELSTLIMNKLKKRPADKCNKWQMKRIITITILLISTLNGIAQSNESLEYLKEYQFEGRLIKIKYLLPNGDSLETFILKIEEPISVKANKDWKELVNVKELHLNIGNSEIEVFENDEVKIQGVLFHALTYHHKRDACIKVENIVRK